MMRKITQQLMCELRYAGARRNGKAPSVKSTDGIKAEVVVDILNDTQYEMLNKVPGLHIKNNPDVGISTIFLCR